MPGPGDAPRLGESDQDLCPSCGGLVAERNERIDALYRLVDRLSEKKRTVLVLHDFEGLPAKEIAEIVEAPVLTVRTRLFYARKELYAALTEEPSLATVVESLMGDLPGKPKKGSKR